MSVHFGLVSSAEMQFGKKVILTKLSCRVDHFGAVCHPAVPAIPYICFSELFYRKPIYLLIWRF